MKSIFYTVLFCLFSSVLWSQNYNADSLFVEVKKIAEAKEYTKAIQLTKQLEKDVPNDKTYSYYLVSLYNWNEQYNEALQQLKSISNQELDNAEVTQLYLSTYRNLKDYEKVVFYSEKAKNEDTYNADRYAIIQAEALLELNETEKATTILKAVSKESQSYDAAQYLLTISNRKKKNSIALGYLLTTYNKPESQNNHYTNLEYTRKWNKDAITARLNYGNAFSENGVSGEVDFYKGLKKSYFYFNAGISDGEFVFPQYKAAAEWYKETQKLSFSIGSKFLGFKTTDDVYIFTGHFGYKLSGNYLLGYRPYYVVNSDQNKVTHALFLKKTNEIKESFWQIDLQYGTVPYYFLSNQVTSDLSSYRIGFNMKTKVATDVFLQPVVLYEYQEFVPSEYRNVFNIQLIATYRF